MLRDCGAPASTGRMICVALKSPFPRRRPGKQQNMDQSRLVPAREGMQKRAADRLMSFQDLKPSSALELNSYDIDHFGETEKYAGASSMPLSAGVTAIMRARLTLPTLTLSLLKTFPRIFEAISSPMLPQWRYRWIT